MTDTAVGARYSERTKQSPRFPCLVLRDREKIGQMYSMSNNDTCNTEK